MDDLVLLIKTKEECIYILERISIFLEDKLHLELNSKSRYYPNKMGVNFCGYRIYETHTLVRNNSKKKMKRKIKKWNKQFKTGELEDNIKESLNSWIGHVKHANSCNLVNKYLDKLDIKDIY